MSRSSSPASARVHRVASHVSGAPLADSAVREFHDNGFIVLRGVLSAAELERLKAPIMRAYSEQEYEASAAYDTPSPEGGTVIGGVPAELARQRQRQRQSQPQRGLYDTPPGAKRLGRYPAAGNHCLGSRILDVAAPQIVPISADHPLVVGAAEQLLGDRAVLSQYQVYCRTPGSLGTGAASAERRGAGSHYDYKPWRPVGSFLRWLFAIVPFVDYDDASGPLLAARASHRRSDVLPSDGRVCRVSCALVPPESTAGAMLQDPHLRAGDVLLMDGFCWHEAWPNNSDADRVGLYMKYHARGAPPACGPTVHPLAAWRACRPATRDSLFRHVRGDGRFCGIRYAGTSTGTGRGHGPPNSVGAEVEPIPTVDSASLVVERADGRVLAIAAATGGGDSESAAGSRLYHLPSVAVDEAAQYTARQLSALQYLDCGNVIGVLAEHARVALGLRVPWMSWIADRLSSTAGEEHLHRVYAFRAGGSFRSFDRSFAKASLPGGCAWVTKDALALPEEAKWVQMWQQEVDDEGRPVVRGIGFAQAPGNRALAATYNAAGNDPTLSQQTWLCADYDDQGHEAGSGAGALVLPPTKLKEKEE